MNGAMPCAAEKKMPHRKPVPGVCGVCGKAVVQPLKKQIDAAFMRTATGREWINGHLYEEDRCLHPTLMKVRCLEHAEEFDPRRQSLGWG